MFQTRQSLVGASLLVCAALAGCGVDLSGSSIKPPRPAAPARAAAPAGAPAAPGQFTPTVAPVLIPPDLQNPIFIPGVGLVPGN